MTHPVFYQHITYRLVLKVRFSGADSPCTRKIGLSSLTDIYGKAMNVTHSSYQRYTLS